MVTDKGLHLRAEILAMDGGTHRGGELRFAHGDAAAPARLAAELLEAAEPELRALFTG